MQQRLTTFTLVLLWLAISNTNAFSQTIYYVKSGGDDIQNGLSWNNAFATLQAALTATAADGSLDKEIWVASGTYYPTEVTTDRTASFIMQNNLAIRGGFVGNEGANYDLSQRDFVANETILSGDIDNATDPDDYGTIPAMGVGGNSYHVILNYQNGLDDSAILDGFSVVGGNADGTVNLDKTGGGIYNLQSSPTMLNCIFTGNSAASNGGGMINLGSNPALMNCTFIGNFSAGSGGGMYNGFGSAPLFTNCSFTGNLAFSSGGGMENDESLPAFTNCTITGNNAAEGAGIYNTARSPIFTNCTITGNFAYTEGGGIYNTRSSSPILTNCIIWNNLIQSSGGSTTYSSIFNDNSTPTITYSLVQGEAASGTNLDGATNASETNYPRFIAPIFPTFRQTVVGDVRLAPCSPVLNVGNNSADIDGVNGTQTIADIAEDLAGNPRIFDESNGGVIDLGAFEFEDNLIPFTGTDGIAYVDANAPATSNQSGSDWSNAFTDLQSALILASCNSAVTQIWVADGTYYPTPDPAKRMASFTMQNNLAILGGFAGNEPATYDLSQRDLITNLTTLSGDIDHATNADDYSTIPATNIARNSFNVIKNYLNELDETALLDGFTIVGGNANGYSFSTEGGGGMSNTLSAPTVTNCIFTGNSTAQDGGGMYNTGNIDPIVTNCTFTKNFANDNGGGMYNQQSNPMVTNCIFTSNRADSGGGGMYNQQNTPTVANCIFTGNIATFSLNGGGGMYNVGRGNAIITNCTFTGNNAAAEGGGIANFSSQPTLINCILWNNQDKTGIGTINANINNRFNSNFTATYSLIQGRAALGTNLDGTTNASDANYPQFITPVDPTTAPTAAGNVRLVTCSPAVNQGSNAANMTTTDVAGEMRIANTTIDLGAHEFHGDIQIAALSDIANAKTSDNGTGDCQTQVSWTHPSLTDNVDLTTCTPQLFTYELSGATTQAAQAITNYAGTQTVTADFNAGETIVTYQATDAVGNQAAAVTFKVTVSDDENPIPTVPSLPNVTGQCSATATPPQANDNCSNGLISATTTDPMTYNSQGTFMITWTYDDGNGNTVTQMQTVIINDTQKPVPVVANLP
ncbi:MAG: right-handed parallel beta-helix repeat-containing protein, partial [Saprospiraceae bacterium]